MGKNRLLCKEHHVDYLSIRLAMVKGARTFDDLLEVTHVEETCGTCKSGTADILKSVCGCKNISLETVVDLVNRGIDTLEGITEITGIGKSCERCLPLVENIVELKR